MQLTRYTDYAIRVLLHVGARDEHTRSSVTQIAQVYGISKDHLKKVVQNLSQAGLLEAVRGRGGGLQLGRPADEITIGEIVRQTESGFDLVDCSSCIVAPACTLPRILREALQAFMAVLDRYTLADILSRKVDMQSLFGGAQTLGTTIKRVTQTQCADPGR
ncbi:Rrf2 family transcriptional regulator [Novosphingobium gossypii]|uniref:Rrf2 family transcriptional regulator n=1 Tax=Novosphingobium gossypii TaxID=1604774 RepID=UPI003D1EE0C3